jgi:hypothetical protein
MRVIWVILFLSGILRAAATPAFYQDVLFRLIGMMAC